MELFREKYRYLLLFENFDKPVFATNLKGRLIFANQATMDLLPLELSLEGALSLKEIFTAGEKPFCLEDLRKTIRKKNTWEGCLSCGKKTATKWTAKKMPLPEQDESVYVFIAKKNEESIPIKMARNKNKPVGKQYQRGDILLVDDDPEVNRSVCTILKTYGYNVSVCKSGEDAICICNNSNHFDLVITDQTMPGITGIELISKLVLNGFSKPVILMTGFSNPIDRDKAKRIGITRILNKPVEPEILINTIKDVIAG